MTSNNHDPNAVSPDDDVEGLVRLNTFIDGPNTAHALASFKAARDSAERAIEVTISSDGPGTPIDIWMIGAADRDDILAMSHTLDVAAESMRAMSRRIESAATEARFRSIVGAEHEPAQAAAGTDVDVYPAWHVMGTIDRALALEYLDHLRRTGQHSDSLPADGTVLRYEQDPMLASLPPEYTHAHALVLDEEFSLTASLRDQDRAALNQALQDHRDRSTP